MDVHKFRAFISRFTNIEFTKLALNKIKIRGISKEEKVKKMVRKAKINYDKENDILWIYSGESVKDSIEIDNFVIDFSKNNKIVGVEIFNASKVLSRLTLSRITKQMLAEIRRATFSSYQSKELIYVVVVLFFKGKEIPIQIPAPIMALK